MRGSAPSNVSTRNSSVAPCLNAMPKAPNRRSSLRLCTNEAGVRASREGSRFHREGFLHMIGVPTLKSQLHRSVSPSRTRLLLVATRSKSSKIACQSQEIRISRSTEIRSGMRSFPSLVHRLNQVCMRSNCMSCHLETTPVRLITKHPPTVGFATGMLNQ